MKKLSLSFLCLSTFLWGGVNERVEQLEKEMKEVGTVTTEGTYGASFVKGESEIIGKGNHWFVQGELLYWDAKIGGSDYVFTSGEQTNLPNPPIRGRMKSNSFGWNWGGRAGVGVVIPHDTWSFFLNFTYYQNHDSSGSKKLPPAFLISQVGFFGGAYESAKSVFDLTYMNVDFEIGKKFFLSKQLSLRPHIGLKGTRMLQEHKVKLHFSPLQLEGQVVTEYYRIHNRCDFDGIGPRIGLQGEWFLGYGFRLESEASGSFLYSYFDVVEKEKTSPNTSDTNTNIRLKGNMKRFIPFAQLFTGLCWGSALHQNQYYLTLKLGYEVLYFWRENQCLKPENWDFVPGQPTTRLNYSRFAEDLSFYGITAKARFDF